MSLSKLKKKKYEKWKGILNTATDSL